MKRCAACGRFFDAEECPGDHSHIETYLPPATEPAKRCFVCGRYFLGDECPHEHGETLPPGIVALGTTVTAKTVHGDAPGVIIGTDGDSYRVLVAYPGENGHVTALSLSREEIS